MSTQHRDFIVPSGSTTLYLLGAVLSTKNESKNYKHIHIHSCILFSFQQCSIWNKFIITIILPLNLTGNS